MLKRMFQRRLRCYKRLGYAMHDEQVKVSDD
jgi:hypothetical protein